MRKIAEAVLDGWPNVQTKCELDVGTGLYKVGRVNRQAFGSRFVLGLVSLGDMDRYGLRSAALQAAEKSFVEPNDSSLASALKLTEQPQEGAPFVLDQADVRKSRTAYPGTMVVYTAAKTHNLPQKEADKVAQFIRISTSEGQKPGFGNGELPGGFLPIRKTGATGALYASAQKVAAAVAKQEVPPTESPSPSNAPSGGGGNIDTTTPIPPAPTSGDPATGAPSASPGATPTSSPEAVAMPKTQAVSTEIGGRLLPGLLVLGLLGMAIASAVRFFLQPPGPRP